MERERGNAEFRERPDHSRGRATSNVNRARSYSAASVAVAVADRACSSSTPQPRKQQQSTTRPQAGPQRRIPGCRQTHALNSARALAHPGVRAAGRSVSCVPCTGIINPSEPLVAGAAAFTPSRPAASAARSNLPLSAGQRQGARTQTAPAPSCRQPRPGALLRDPSRAACRQRSARPAAWLLLPCPGATPPLPRPAARLPSGASTRFTSECAAGLGCALPETLLARARRVLLLRAVPALCSTPQRPAAPPQAYAPAFVARTLQARAGAVAARGLRDSAGGV